MLSLCSRRVKKFHQKFSDLQSCASKDFFNFCEPKIDRNHVVQLGPVQYYWENQATASFVLCTFPGLLIQIITNINLKRTLQLSVYFNLASNIAIWVVTSSMIFLCLVLIISFLYISCKN